MIRRALMFVLALAAADADAGDDAVWAFDPGAPGPDVPTAGRSLFDFVFIDQSRGIPNYAIPFPFSELTAYLAARMEAATVGPALPRVLIPRGRSLQRDAAAPHFFQYPRAVIAAVTDFKAAPGVSGIHLRDRLYIGYNEKAAILEVISYNEAAGRYEFQIVKNYDGRPDPEVLYANRDVCIACHQNGAAIFSRPPWSETNANRRIAARLSARQRDFYDISVNDGIDIPDAIDRSTDRANLQALWQLLWREGCAGGGDAEAARCRIGLFTSMLRHRLGSGAGFLDAGDAASWFPPAMRRHAPLRWPHGIRIGNPDIPDHDPFQAVPAAHDPLAPRPALETWLPARSADRHRAMAGLSGLITTADIHRLDRHIYAAGEKQMRSAAREAQCDITGKPGTDDTLRVSFECTGAALSASGRVYIHDDRVTRGVIERLRRSGHDLTGLQATGRVARAGAAVSIHLRLTDRGRHARFDDGHAVQSLVLHMPAGDRPVSGTTRHRGSITLRGFNDFALIEAALAGLAASMEGDTARAFSSAPFRRAAVLELLFAELGMPPVTWCCLDDRRMPIIRTARDSGRGVAGALPAAVGRFVQYCARCHRTPEKTPPNWLAGGQERMSAGIAQCAERIFYRLGMWDLPRHARPRAAMPPLQVLHGHAGESWRGALAEMRNYVADVLTRQHGAAPALDGLIARGYDRLRPCL